VNEARQSNFPRAADTTQRDPAIQQHAIENDHARSFKSDLVRLIAQHRS
jgi:hypothetical protein